jgi:hypothetical protein
MQRVNLKDLGKHGLIRPGDVLIWRRSGESKIYEVVVTQKFLLEAEDFCFRTPSQAAKFFNGDKPVNGWLVWKLRGQHLSLDNLRSKLNTIGHSV